MHDRVTGSVSVWIAAPVSSGSQRFVGAADLPACPRAKLEDSAFIGGGQDPGFFTSISSNGSTNPIIWALSRPSGSGNNISLFAFDPETGGSTLKQLFQASAGTWPYLGGNANLVPVVANGQVFVASYKQLSIFGLTNGVTNG